MSPAFGNAGLKGQRDIGALSFTVHSANLRCEDGREAAGVPAAVEPAEARHPSPAEPAQVANVEAAVSAAVDRPPEEDVASVVRFIPLPAFGNEFRVSEEVI